MCLASIGRAKGAPGTRGPPLGLISFIFMQFQGENWTNNRLRPSPLELGTHREILDPSLKSLDQIHA